jgi:hypothetical protein
MNFHIFPVPNYLYQSFKILNKRLHNNITKPVSKTYVPQAK